MFNNTILTLSLLSLYLPGFAQTPSTPRPASNLSPEVRSDHSVTFRFKASGAKDVTVWGQWTKEPMRLTRGDDGIWSGTASAVPAGIWEYSFNLDGLTMLDPGNPAIKPMREPRTSILTIPGSPPQIWDFQDVPHGTVHVHDYFSRVFARQRELCVYTPPDYETNLAQKYPLLILQHGSGDNQQTWVVLGKAHWILDNLIAQRKARAMVVVMLDGHSPGIASQQSPPRRDGAPSAFRRELFEDALPLVENRYRVEPDATQRGIVGLSMGGGQSLTVGLGNLDRFAWVGSFSGVPPDDAVTKSVFADPAGTNAKLRLLWLGCGKEDGLLKHNEEFIDKLKSAQIDYQWHLSEGGHSWPVWRGYLAQFLPLLFQPKS